MTRMIGLLVALVVTLGILAPLGSGGLAALGLADGRVMVICTGDGLRTLRIGSDGQPVETSDKAWFCALSQATDTATAPMPPPARTALLFSAAPALPQPPQPLRPSFRASLPRAPPAV